MPITQSALPHKSFAFVFYLLDQQSDTCVAIDLVAFVMRSLLCGLLSLKHRRTCHNICWSSLTEAGIPELTRLLGITEEE